MAKAATRHITLDRGAHYQKTLTIKNNAGLPYNIEEAVFEGSIADPNSATGAVAAVFSFELTTDGTDGRVETIITPTESLKLQKDKFYVYDIWMTNDGRVRRLFKGNVDLRFNTTPQP